jgi:DNA-binding GntR family transcriptional regulator
MAVSREPKPADAVSRARPRRRPGLGLGPIGPRPSRTREVLDIVRASIVDGELAAGSLHSVAELAATLGVSRTPVREALIELASRGMVRFERNRGVRILQTSIHDLQEIFEIRLLLEVPAARRAVVGMRPDAVRALRSHLASMERAAAAGDEGRLWTHDRAFHHALMVASGNRRLADVVDVLRDMVLLRGVTTAGRARSLAAIVAEHRAIFEQVEARDADAAAAALRAHIEHTAELLIAQEQGLLEPA